MHHRTAHGSACCKSSMCMEFAMMNTVLHLYHSTKATTIAGSVCGVHHGTQTEGDHICSGMQAASKF
eukprot:1133400-Pelagomonas_calceolata.AAC.2